MTKRLAPVLALLLLAATVQAAELTNLFMLHHSTGRNLIQEGDIRGWITDWNAAKGTALELWDHDYNAIGLTDPDGHLVGESYVIPDDNTDPDGLLTLWTTPNSARVTILANHDVIAFKSCYPASNIETDAELELRKQWYLQMRNVFDQYPAHVFVVMSQPPRHRLATNTAEADRARDFANWLVSDAYLAGHPNVVAFDLFTQFANPDDGSATRNMLRWEYERSHYDADSHPNALANAAVGPLMAEAIVSATGALNQSTGADLLPTSRIGLSNHPNPFNPSTQVAFTLERDDHVRLTVHDLAGRQVSVLAEGDYLAGEHVLQWDGRAEDGRALPSGVYLCRAAGRTEASLRRMTLLR
jgi:hypothetical protein